MLKDPALLISGSRGRGACWTGAEYGGCRPTVDPATPHAHLRDHVNGNAMYRLGGELSRLIAAARAQYGATVPFDVAMHLVGGGKRTSDNARAYSVMGLPVDEARFAEPTYYGTNVAFVHAPRRLRAPALSTVARRLEAGRPVTVVVVPADGVDEALLGHLYKGLVRARETRNALFLATDEAGYAAAVRVAPMRVVMAGEVTAADGLDARPAPDIGRGPHPDQPGRPGPRRLCHLHHRHGRGRPAAVHQAPGGAHVRAGGHGLGAGQPDGRGAAVDGTGGKHAEFVSFHPARHAAPARR